MYGLNSKKYADVLVQNQTENVQNKNKSVNVESAFTQL